MIIFNEVSELDNFPPLSALPEMKRVQKKIDLRFDSGFERVLFDSTQQCFEYVHVFLI